MFDGKFITTLIALIVAVFAICNMNTSKSVSSMENFIPHRVQKMERIVAKSTNDAVNGIFYATPGYQSMLSPRFNSYSTTSHTSGYLPEAGNLALDPTTNNMTSQCQASTFNNMVESFDGQDNMVESVDGQHTDDSSPVQDYTDVTEMIPVETMASLNADGTLNQPIVYDRMIYANRNSRLRSQGDPIRGDLPIVPCSADWFRPSVHPVIDLQQGAMNVLAGTDNETTQALSQLVNASSGETTIAGVNMAGSKELAINGPMATVQVTSFP